VKTYSRVLALGAHTDDIELGCGAFLNRLRREGAEIAVMAFSRAEESLGPGMEADVLEREFRDAMALIGVDNIYVGKVPVRRFPEYRQDILEELVSASREYQPDLVLTMNSQDTHQDHQVIHQESIRAFRGRTLLGYETPWNQQQNVTELFVEVSPEDVDKKAAMLRAYRSQTELGRRYMEREYVDSAATFRGYQSRMPLAEAFEVITMTWDL
jgi:LmbE family N-acetylglucosaminyl deacetylase